MVLGSIVEPSTIKRFKSRLADGHIIEVTEQNFDKWRYVFKERYGVTLSPVETVPVETVPKATVKKVAAKVKVVK